MKKKIATGILTLAMVAGMSTSAFAASSDIVNEHEQKGESLNDKFSDAQMFDLTENVYISGSLSKGDKDYYRFSPTESGSFQFDFTPSADFSAGGVVVTLYDEKKNEITSKELSSSNSVIFTEDLDKRHYYYLKVQNKASKSSNYGIWIDIQN